MGGFCARPRLTSLNVCHSYVNFNLFYFAWTTDFPLTLARWPMASEHCRRTSDFLSYWPGLASGISKITEKLKKKKN